MYALTKKIISEHYIQFNGNVKGQEGRIVLAIHSPFVSIRHIQAVATM
jgi:hypothetical protein